MKKRIKYLGVFFMLLVLAGCVEKFDFNIQNIADGIVIEASISNKSFIDTQDYPSEGRYFHVRLGKTSDVDNVLDETISEALVKLVDSEGNEWTYTENANNLGTYELKESFFKAQPDRAYQLQITLSTGEQFESAWERMPTDNTQIGELAVKEEEVDVYVFIKPEETLLQTHEGLELMVMLPEVDDGKPRYYRWTFEPTWIYRSPNFNVPDEIKTCWITTPYYLNQYTVKEDAQGGFDQRLFFMRTVDNHRLYEYFSAIIVQTEITEGYYYFWKDLQAQSNNGGLFDIPPFSVPTNFEALNSDWTVNGYFGVTAENATRWTFDPESLSYDLVDNLYELCQIRYGPGKPGGPECCDCREYPYGKSLNYPPNWW